ncbi:MAG: class I SAM-dependent methyltransferase [Candidatus Berkelbacteria bacterium]|nr:class I SAM-dependent methyltransferase [Candidatus Berkelbacteria bacterium]
MSEGKFYSEADLSSIETPDRKVREAIENLWTKEKDVIDRGYDSYLTLMENGRIFDETGLDEYSFDGISEERFDQILSQGKILDVACGKGEFVKDCLRKKYDAYGIDLALTQEDAAKQINESSPEIIGRIVAGDGTKLPFGDKSFKTIMNIFGVPSYLFDSEKVGDVLAEQLRVLADDGCIIIHPISFRDNVPYPTNYVKKLAGDESGEFEKRGGEVSKAFAELISKLESDGEILVERHSDRDRLYEPGHLGGNGYIIIKKFSEKK